MLRKRLRLISQIENYKEMVQAFEKNGNPEKAKECADKVKSLQDDLVFMTVVGINPQHRVKGKKGKRTYSLIIALAIILIASMAIALAVVTKENRELKQQVKDLTVMITAEREQLPELSRGNVNRLESIGKFTISYYCPCEKCCGKSNGITASGTRAREGKTISVDPSVIPLGTEVIIDGHEYTAEDTGAGIVGNHIDMFVESHEKALQLGVRSAEVFVEMKAK